MANPNFYNIELRDKGGYLRQYLTPFAKDISWEWNRIGGCGRARMKLALPYRKINFSADDDIQIRMRNEDYDPYVKLVSHFDGADAAVAYTDPIAGAYTFVNHAQLDTAQKVFGSVSLLLDGTDDYVTLPDSDSWNFGTGDFTISFRAMIHNLPAEANYDGIFTHRDADGVGSYTFRLENNAGNYQLKFWFCRAGDGWQQFVWSWTPIVDTWYHVAFIRKDGVVKVYINGVAFDIGQNLPETLTKSNSAVFSIGWDLFENYFDGWIDEFRVSKGIARWTSNFTPPNQPYKYTSAPSKLVYRGWISGITPSLKVPQEITLDVRGYFDKLNFFVVQDAGAKKTYTNQFVSTIVDNIISTFITPNTSITKGTIDTATFTVDSIAFKTQVSDALNTLAELEGKIEYGVDENLVFFWRIQDENLRHKFIVGNDVELFERKVDWSQLLNRIYFEGGDVGGNPYLKTAESQDSQTMYFIAEGIVNNSSITTSSVADQYLSSKLRDGSSPKLVLRVKVPNTTLRLEDTVPLGEIAVYDSDYDENLYIVGEAVDGGSDLTVGLWADGGSDALIGGVFQDQIERIAYTLSNTEERFNIEITMGGSISENFAKTQQLELLLNNLRQYQ